MPVVTKAKTFMIRLHDSYRTRDEAELNEFLKTAKIKRMSSALATVSPHGIAWEILIFYEEASAPANTHLLSQPSDFATGEEVPEIQLDPSELVVYEALRKWRNQRALNTGLKPFQICHNETLKEIVKARPKTSQDLRTIRGILDHKIAAYGDDIIAVLWGEILPSQPASLINNPEGDDLA